MIEVAAPDAAPLRWLLDILIAGGHVERSDTPARVVGDFTVVPSPGRARFLLPAGSPKVAAASLTAYNGLRLPRVAAIRALIAAAVRFGVAGALRHRVTVHTTAEDGSEELAQRWLPEHLRQVLDVPRLHLAVGLSLVGPYAKPTLQLFDDDGRPLGYAKIGWNDATRRVVAREVEVLRSWPEEVAVRTPGSLYSGRWQERMISMSVPLPLGVRRVPSRRWPCRDDSRAVSSTAACGDHAIGVAGWVPEALAAVDALAGLPAGGAALDAGTDFEALRDVEVPHGLAHGDWVPWNLAVDGNRLVAWDWEHALDDAPLGFDIVHWAYQQRVVIRRQSTEEGFVGGLEDARPHLTALGLDRRQADAVAAAHRLGVVTREALPNGRTPAPGAGP